MTFHRAVFPATLLFLVLATLGCSTPAGRTVTSNVDFSLTKPLTIYWDEWVRKGAPQVFVAPDRAPECPPTAVFMPFRMTQRMEHANSIGYNLSRIVWQTWLQESALPTIEFAENAPPYRPDLALAWARRRNADLVIGGTINYFNDGGTVGDSGVSIAMEIYDVKSGHLLWSMGQAAVMQVTKVNDYILFATKTRMPSDPVTACLTASASDLAKLVQRWAYDAPPVSGKLFEPSAF